MERKLVIKSKIATITSEIKTEVIRKSIHILVGLTPLIANLTSPYITIALLMSGAFLFTIAEILRLNGITVPLLSTVTHSAMRKRDQGKFVLGPVTLAIGASTALFFYPEPAATLAIYSLAFGDGLASLIGKLFGSIKLPYTNGKSLEGSLTCFTAILICAIAIFPSASPAAIISVSLAGAFIEALPLKDYDNILLPLVTGFLAYSLF